MATGDELQLRPTRAFSKDLKRLRKQGRDLGTLYAAIEVLRTRQRLEPRLQDHALKGNWLGWRECHVRSDWLLVYQVEEEAGMLILGRSGTHAELFGK